MQNHPTSSVVRSLESVQSKPITISVELLQPRIRQQDVATQRRHVNVIKSLTTQDVGLHDHREELLLVVPNVAELSLSALLLLRLVSMVDGAVTRSETYPEDSATCRDKAAAATTAVLRDDLVECSGAVGSIDASEAALDDEDVGIREQLGGGGGAAAGLHVDGTRIGSRSAAVQVAPQDTVPLLVEQVNLLADLEFHVAPASSCWSRREARRRCMNVGCSDPFAHGGDDGFAAASPGYEVQWERWWRHAACL